MVRNCMCLDAVMRRRILDTNAETAERQSSVLAKMTIYLIKSVLNSLVTLPNKLKKIHSAIKILLGMLFDYMTDVQNGISDLDDIGMYKVTYVANAGTSPSEVFKRKKVAREKIKKAIKNRKIIISALKKLDSRLKQESSAALKKSSLLMASGEVDKKSENVVSEIQKDINKIISNTSRCVTFQDYLTKFNMINLRELADIGNETMQKTLPSKYVNATYDLNSPSFLDVRKIISLLSQRTYSLEKTGKLPAEIAEKVRKGMDSLLKSVVISTPDAFEMTISTAQKRFLEGVTLSPSSKREYSNMFKKLKSQYEQFARSNGLTGD